MSRTDPIAVPMRRRMQAPPWWGYLLLLLGILFFGNLSAWQWRRASEKTVLLRDFAAANQANPLDLEAGLQRLAKGSQFVAVQLHGVTRKIILRDNQSSDGKIGVHVLRLLQLQDGRQVLVNEGWWPMQKNRAVASLPMHALPATETINGLLVPWPTLPRIMQLQASVEKRGEFDLILQLQREAIQDLLPQGAVLADGIVLRFPEASSPFVRQWNPNVFPPERHLGYAMTWAIFLVLSVVLFVILNLKRVPHESQS